MSLKLDYTQTCGRITPRTGRPCGRPRGHDRTSYPGTWGQEYLKCRPVALDHEDTPRLRQFRRVVELGLDHGVQLGYMEIAELMGMNVRSVAQSGPGARYTRLRARIYKERGVVPDGHRRSAEQSLRVVEDMRAAHEAAIVEEVAS